MIFDKLRKFDIVFDSSELHCPPVFSSGDVVSGRVVLDLSGRSKVDSIKLHAEGFAKVHWTESRSAGSSTAYTQNYSDEVEYLNRREALVQAGQYRSGDTGKGSWDRGRFVRTRLLLRQTSESAAGCLVSLGTLGSCLSLVSGVFVFEA